MAETALVVLVPELEPLIGDWRRRATPSGTRGLPAHVTLVVPFADSSEIDELRPSVAGVLARFEPFEVTFRGIARFPDTLYLEPAPAQPFVAMIDALVRAFPDFPGYGGEFDEIVPHATVAQGADELLDRAEREVVPGLPISVRVERVWLVDHSVDGWRRHTAFPLNRR